MIDRRNFLSKLAGLLGLGIFGTKANAKTELSPEDIVKAWENPEFRNSLTKAQWEALPDNPAGDIKGGEFNGNLEIASGNYCSGNSCSGDSCSGNSCSGDSCSGNSCSGNSCSGDSCSGNSCSGNTCSSWGC